MQSFDSFSLPCPGRLFASPKLLENPSGLALSRSIVSSLAGVNRA